MAYSLVECGWEPTQSTARLYIVGLHVASVTVVALFPRMCSIFVSTTSEISDVSITSVGIASECKPLHRKDVRICVRLMSVDTD